MTRYIIIGTGIAGFSATQTLRSLEPNADITLVSHDPHGFYSRPGLAYYLTGEIPEKQLFPFLKKSQYNPRRPAGEGSGNTARSRVTCDRDRSSRDVGV